METAHLSTKKTWKTILKQFTYWEYFHPPTDTDKVKTTKVDQLEGLRIALINKKHNFISQNITQMIFMQLTITGSKTEIFENRTFIHNFICEYR